MHKQSFWSLVVGFSLILAIMALFSIRAIQRVDALADLTVQLYRHPLAVSNAVLEVDGHIIDMRRDIEEVVMATDTQTVKETRAVFDTHVAQVHQRFDLIRERYLGEKSTLEAAYAAFVEWEKILAEGITLKQNGQQQAAALMIHDTGTAQAHQRLNRRMMALISFAHNKAAEFLANSRSQQEEARINLLFLMIFGLASGGWIAWHTLNRLQQTLSQLQKNEEQTSAIVENVADGIVTLNEHQIITQFSPAAERLFGYRADEMIGKTVGILMPEPIRSQHPTHVARMARREGKWRREKSLETVGLRRDGSEFPIEISISMTKTREHTLFVAAIRDITERKQIEIRLSLTKRVIECASEAIMITDVEAKITDVNPAYEQISGYSREEVLGKTPSITKSGRHPPAFYQAMWQEIHKNGGWSGEIWDRRKSGEIFPKWLSISAIRDTEGKINHYVGLFRDISQQKETEEKLERLAFFDPLTQLPNRELFRDRLNREIIQARRLGIQSALFFIDLDHFKHVNDTLGHDRGDGLLVQVAERITNCLRASDTVCRLGGDEFTVILSGLKKNEDAGLIARSIIAQLQAVFHLEDQEVFVGASIGIALLPENGDDYETLTKRADVAMYRAKEAGRGVYKFFTPDMDRKNAIRLALEKDLRHAIDKGHLTVFYQPKILVENDTIHGMEALVRWIHPEKGIISPADFIPLAEETGLIVPLGEWVLKESCRQLKQWWDEGLPHARVAVNLSARQFQAANLLTMIQQTLEETGLPPEGLELEITESIAMQEVEKAIETMNGLRALGCYISIDDFGTGYSSLSLLKKFPLHALKIDQSFVRDLTMDSDDAAIVASIISMARTMKLWVVAEGVETIEQVKFLKENGCHEMQGYFYSKPVPAPEFKKLLEKAPHLEKRSV